MDISSSISPSSSNKSTKSNTSDDRSLEDNTSFETMYTSNDTESKITDPNDKIRITIPYHQQLRSSQNNAKLFQSKFTKYKNRFIKKIDKQSRKPH